MEKLSNSDIVRRSESRAELALASGKVLLTDCFIRENITMRPN
ncbi:hypothetical protein [Hoylesella pleuritidis]|nr:hypothetical protein [Hoylesella pleuritidis]